MKPSYKKVIVLILLALPIVLSECKSPFALRDSEAPNSVQSNWVQPYSPEQVILNMQSAVYEKNVENFVRCLADSSFSSRRYSFDPEPEVAANYEGYFYSWTREQEKTVMQHVFSLIPPDSSSFLDFPETYKEVSTADSVVIERRYLLELHHTGSGLPSVMEGRMELWIAGDERGEWSIYHWIDRSIGEKPSWSHLKASFGG